MPFPLRRTRMVADTARWQAGLAAVSGTTAEVRQSMNTSLQQGHLISGMHAIVFSREADKVRAFFGDVLGLPAVDAGGGWLIFALPPAELAVHPADGPGHHELYLMCDDIHATLAELKGKGVEVAREVSDQGGGYWPPFACRTAGSSPFTSPGTHRPFSPEHARSRDPYR